MLVLGGVVALLIAVVIVLAIRNNNLRQETGVQEEVTETTSEEVKKVSTPTGKGTKTPPPPEVTYPAEYSSFQITYQCTGYCRDTKSLIYEFNLDTPKVITFNRVVFTTKYMSAGQSVTVSCNTYQNTKTITATKDSANQWSTTSCNNVSGTKVHMVVNVTGSGTGVITPLFEKWQVVDTDTNRLVKILQ